MQLRMFPLLTILFLSTNQILSMDWFKSWTSDLLMVLFGSPWNKSTAKKEMMPLVEFSNATEEEKDLIKKCNGLELDDYGSAHATHRHQFLAFLEAQVATIDLPENKLKEYLKSERPALQKKFKKAYPDTNEEMVNSNFADRTANILIELYIGVRPQLIQNGTEKEYFKKRLDVHKKKHQDLRTLQTEHTMIYNLCHINKTVKENKKEEEGIDSFLKSDSFEKKDKQLPGLADAIPKFLDLQKKYPDYKSRKTFITNEVNSLFKLYPIIENRTGFEPYFMELCCCASYTPTEVLQIINDYLICNF